MTSLHVLDLGSVWCDKGFNFTPGSGDGEMILVPVPAYLIETDTGERVLVDTGVHERHIEDPDYTFRGTAFVEYIRPAMRDEHRVERQLELLGLSIGDITHVVNTHLHFDHCGQNHLFTSVPILVQREHLAAARGHPSFPSEFYDLPQLSYTLLDGEGEIFPGVRTLVVSGHAPHLMALIVELEAGPVLLCGDAIPLQEVVTRDAWTGFADPGAAERSGHRLLKVAHERGARMLYGHDIAQWEHLPRAPAAFV